MKTFLKWFSAKVWSTDDGHVICDDRESKVIYLNFNNKEMK